MQFGGVQAVSCRFKEMRELEESRAMRNSFSMLIRRRALLLLMLVGVSLASIAAAAEAPAQRKSIADLLDRREPVDGLFFAILPATSHTGRDAIQLPRLAETLLPLPHDGDQREPVSVEMHWFKASESRSVQAAWYRSERGVSSELRFPESIRRANLTPNTTLLLSRSAPSGPGLPPEFDCRLIAADRRTEREIVLSHFGLSSSDARPGLFGIQSPWSPRAPPLRSTALQTFLGRFDEVAARGFVPTLRSGSTGIGYTLETLLDISENNSPAGDFLGMELKAHRGRDLESLSTKKMNLFLKEPVWTDGLTHRERIPKYGYVDGNGRVALYSTVTSRQNSHGLKLVVSRDLQRLDLHFRNQSVAYWNRETLQSRLREKLTETSFVGAVARGRGREEEFHYQSVLYCEQPAVDAFLQLVASRDVMLEMRMHIREDGSARNHGSAFRIRLDQLPRLFGRTVLMRSEVADGAPSAEE